MTQHNLRRAMRTAPRVPYGGHRPEFRSGDLYAQSHGGWGSWRDFKVMCVRVFTLSTCSHVGVIEVDESDGYVYAVGAVRPEVHRVLLSSIGPYHHPPTAARWGDMARRYGLSVLGALYHQLDAMRAFFAPLATGTVTECGALAREVMQRAGVNLRPISRPIPSCSALCR